jgi:tetratricopeptide (TPR) repeat protein
MTAQNGVPESGRVMRTVINFVILWGASALAVCAAQVPAPATTSGPQVIVAPPQITFAAPRPAFKKLPTTSLAASSAPQTAANAPSTAPTTAPTTASGTPEVTVTGHRATVDPDWVDGKPRFYVETNISDLVESNMAIANGRECANESLPIPKRISSCDMAIWKAMHGASVENRELAKVYVARAVAFQQNGDDQAATKDFNTAGKLDRTNPRPWIGLGNLYAAKADYPHAFANYDRAMYIAPDDPVIYDNRGTALESMGRHDEAIADFSRAIVLDPQDTSAFSNRAMVYRASKRMDLAITDLAQVIRADPSDGLAYYDRGTAYELSGELDKARTDYRETVRRMPSFAPASAALGRLDSKDDPQLALAEFGAAIRLDPKSPALRARGLLYLSLEEPERALPDLDRVIANDGSDAIAWTNRGVAKAKLGDFAGAIADCTRAIELAPTVANRVNRGNAYATMHRDDEALADFDMALQSEPRNLPALLGRANTDYSRKRLAAALDDYTRAIDADPHSAITYFKRGNIHLDLMEFDFAFADYTESLKLDPNQPVVLVNRSIAAARLGRRSEAANDQHRALELDPSILDDKR